MGRSIPICYLGNLFCIQYYGIVFKDDKYREQINRIILKYQKNGIFDKIYLKWFGKEYLTKLEDGKSS